MHTVSTCRHGSLPRGLTVKYCGDCCSFFAILMARSSTSMPQTLRTNRTPGPSLVHTPRRMKCCFSCSAAVLGVQPGLLIILDCPRHGNSFPPAKGDNGPRRLAHEVHVQDSSMARHDACEEVEEQLDV